MCHAKIHGHRAAAFITLGSVVFRGASNAILAAASLRTDRPVKAHPPIRGRPARCPIRHATTW
jgi:hypothetical protein